MPTSQDPARPAETEYVLGTNAAEIARLGLQHRLWADAAHSLWRRAGIQPGWAVLDVGSGPGFATLDLAQLVSAGNATLAPTPPGRIVAIDESQSYLDYLSGRCRAAGIHGVQTVRADVLNLESLDAVDPGSFDAAYARWVFCFVSDPGKVVRGAHRALRPGGRFIVQDYFNYESMCVAPRQASFAKAVAATGRAWRSRGGDPDVVGRLTGIFEQSGFRLTHLDVNQRVARPGDPMWQWPETFWRNFLPVLVGMGLLTEDDGLAWERDWNTLSRTPGAFAVVPPVFDLIAERL